MSTTEPVPGAADFAQARWTKSSRSSSGQCVEVAALDHHGHTYVGVGDTKTHEPGQPPAEVLTFSRAQWARFIAGRRSR